MVLLRMLDAICVALFTVALLGGQAHAGQCRRQTANDEAKTVGVVYAVADLVVPVNASPTGAPTLEATLMKVISQAIDPPSWSDNGGAATIQYFPTGMALVVNQTRANHEKITELLASLRRLQDVEVALEFRLVAV